MALACQIQQRHDRQGLSGGHRICPFAQDGDADSAVVGTVVAGLTSDQLLLQLAIPDPAELAWLAVHAPVGRRRALAELELLFLHIHAELDKRARTAVNDEAGHDGRHQAAAVQHHPHLAVTQHHVEVVIAQCPRTLLGQIGLQPVGQTEQLQRLIQHMGAEIDQSPEPGPPASRQRWRTSGR